MLPSGIDRDADNDFTAVSVKMWLLQRYGSVSDESRKEAERNAKNLEEVEQRSRPFHRTSL